MSTRHSHRARERFDLDVCDSSMRPRAYVALVTLLTVLDLGIFVAAAYFIGNERFGLGMYLAVLGIALLAIIWAAVAVVREADVTAFLTTSMVAGLLGLLSGPLMAQYGLGSTLRIFGLVLIIVALFGTLGVFMPTLPGRLSGVLVSITLILGAVMTVIYLGSTGYTNAFTGLDVAFVVLFSVWVLYDFNQLFELGRTPASAAYIGLGIFLDIVNLFIWIGKSIGNIDWPKSGGSGPAETPSDSGWLSEIKISNPFDDP